MALPAPHEWAFFMALGLFRMAAILAGVGARARQGNASSAHAAQVTSGNLYICMPDHWWGLSMALG